MERSKNDILGGRTWLQKLVVCPIALLLSTLPISAQEKGGNSGGKSRAWIELSLGGGNTTRSKPFEGISPGDKGGVFVDVTLGLHDVLGIKRLQLGGGLNRMGFGHPRFLTFTGMHVALKYKPLVWLKGLYGSARLNLAIKSVERGYHNVYYTPYGAGDLSLGWEFPRILGAVGIGASVGASLTAFGYKYPVGHINSGIYAYRNSTQGIMFFRFSILIN